MSDSISYTSQTAHIKLRSKNEIVFNPNGDPALGTTFNDAVPTLMVTMGIALGLCPNGSRSSRRFSRSHAARHAVGVRPGDTAESMPVWLQDVTALSL